MNRQEVYNIFKHSCGKALTFVIMLSSIFVVGACYRDDTYDVPAEEQFAELVISIGSIDNAVPVTRVGVEEEFPYERKIEECCVVLFDSEGNWFMTVTTDKFTIDNNDIDSRSEATVEIPLGTYTGYAFANLHNLENGLTLTGALENGKQLDDTDLTMNYLNSLAVSLGTDASVFKSADGGKAIPMSSYVKENITVQKNAYNKTEIGMFRMLGKVTITVTNQLETGAFSLKALSVGKFRKGDILFIPYKEGNITLDDILNGTALQEMLQPKFPQNVSAESYVQTVVSDADNVSIEKGVSRSFSFYAFETGTETNQQSNTDIQVQIQVNDRDLATKNTDFSFMRRNDWLKIPILVSGIETSLWFENTRMPIGGLPYQVKYGDTDGIQILVDAVNVIDPDYAGPVKVSFELKNIMGTTGSLNIKFPPVSGSDTKPWSEATLTGNEDDLLIDKNTGKPVTVVSGSEPEVTLTAGEPDSEGNITSGSFEVWTQELGNDAFATIRLTLVAEYGEDGNRSSMEIPYTIRIQNYK